MRVYVVINQNKVPTVHKTKEGAWKKASDSVGTWVKSCNVGITLAGLKDKFFTSNSDSLYLTMQDILGGTVVITVTEIED